MKQRYKVFAAIILVMVVGLVFIDSTKNTTFKKFVLDHLNMMEVSSIEIIRSRNAIEDKITVTDPSQIELVMNAFPQITLRREESYPHNIPAESYWIIIKTNKIRQFGLTLYGKDYVHIFDYNSKTKNSNKLYKITNEFDPIVIRGLFS